MAHMESRQEGPRVCAEIKCGRTAVRLASLLCSFMCCGLTGSAAPVSIVPDKYMRVDGEPVNTILTIRKGS